MTFRDIKNNDIPMIILGAATVGATLGFLIFNIKIYLVKKSK